ncbi:histidine phosphatase family protein [Rathayibacter iranicus]|uniref:Histidine phosphatase family protein n=2 Tax=Rathayibacter iranicus TaxID=59737 RepID=A0AAD1ENZ5_9MICO|nr:histidine phosphatase family protein [Rathayibacter iranicus]AZZ57059.1 histidine phosphatase family protein [Rathayibacter iranicus]MWV29679.1 histidine phosphatase family protein [Rathayibacter iranicus NCPPB 2253 = VKM Ac-1602]PPI57726.1 histidine phosphatase family protein [Rathayibacter iranicus]PPI68528.1 histidine phosphatase family protein [Rathayibacter iranicus]PWJ66764.1 broad specificity phosphatase PhoE [Rathayibacter iranicus NCPPB 2253 = VKM Ac-1602]
MVADQIHLVRHGEVFNPDRVLYGRLPNFRLSDLGHRMARSAADNLLERRRHVTVLIASPLQRTQESAQPISQAFELEIRTDERVIEPSNHFEGTSLAARNSALRNPKHWPWLRNPFEPSWGEPYLAISARMYAAIESAWEKTARGDAAIVSHQLPIWTAHRALAGERLFHDPRKRRCALSSITTLERRGDGFVEVGYSDPAADLQGLATDVGAV